MIDFAATVKAFKQDVRSSLWVDLSEALSLLRETKGRQRYDKDWTPWKKRRDALLKRYFTSRHRKGGGVK